MAFYDRFFKRMIAPQLDDRTCTEWKYFSSLAGEGNVERLDIYLSMLEESPQHNKENRRINSPVAKPSLEKVRRRPSATADPRMDKLARIVQAFERGEEAFAGLSR